MSIWHEGKWVPLEDLLAKRKANAKHLESEILTVLQEILEEVKQIDEHLSRIEKEIRSSKTGTSKT